MTSANEEVWLEYQYSSQTSEPFRVLKAYAGASPITRASGKKPSITRRWVKNDRLNHAGYLWAFAFITASPGAKAHYRRRRDDHGDCHAAVLRTTASGPRSEGRTS